MRFMALMIPRVYQPQNGKTVGPGFTPDAEMMAAMGRFNDGLKAKGALLSVDGLQPLSAGARLAFSGGPVKFTDGPAVDTKEVLGGYWLLQADSKQEVVEWMKGCPAQDGDVIEIRQVAEMEDFPEEVQAAARDRKS